MPSVDRQLSGPAPGLPRPRSALVIATAAYADARLARLRQPARAADALVPALSSPEIGRRSPRFLATRAENETVLVYLSCHGIQDRKHLYFAAADTRLGPPRGT